MKATWTASEHGLSFLAYNGEIIMAFWPGIDVYTNKNNPLQYLN